MAKPRLTWRKQPNESGLARVCQMPRGALLKVNGEDVGRVYPRMTGWGREQEGWYWTAGSDAQGIPLRNTVGAPVPDLDAAKAECEAYVREALAKKGKGTK